MDENQIKYLAIFLGILIVFFVICSVVYIFVYIILLFNGEMKRSEIAKARKELRDVNSKIIYWKKVGKLLDNGRKVDPGFQIRHSSRSRLFQLEEKIKPILKEKKKLLEKKREELIDKVISGFFKSFFRKLKKLYTNIKTWLKAQKEKATIKIKRLEKKRKAMILEIEKKKKLSEESLILYEKMEEIGLDVKDVQNKVSNSKFTNSLFGSRITIEINIGFLKIGAKLLGIFV